MKTCKNPNCTQINPQGLMSFSKKKSAKNGLEPQCKICHRAYGRTYRQNNPEKEKEHHKKYRKNNKEKVKERQKKYCQDNQEKVKEQQREYQQNNKGKVNASTAKRRAARLQATPKWVSKEQLLEIKGFYIEAARRTEETGIKHHVDHILPIQGENVTGLHVPWNLQILTAEENRKKSNKIIA
jgi:hypothetical protein